MLSKRYLTLIIALVVLVIYLLTTVFFVVLRRQPGIPGTTPTGAPFPTTIRTTPVTRPPVEYDQEGSEKLLEIIKEKKPLTNQDSQVRTSLLGLVDGQSGIVITQPTFRLEYVKTPNIFQAEIFTTDVAQGKKDTVAWLTNRGLTHDGICHLPLSFYLNRDIALQLGQLRYTFNPLPEGC